MRMVSALTLLGLMSATFAAEAPTEAQSSLQIQSFDEKQSIFFVNTPEWELADVQLQHGDYQRILTEMNGQLRLHGAPELPTTTSQVAVPQEGDLSTSFSYSSETIVQDVDLLPFQAVQLEAEAAARQRQPDPEIYQNDAWYPSSPVILHERATIRDITVATLEVTPFQYNPVRRELRVLEGLVVELNHDESLTEPSRPVSRFFEPIYQSLIPNYPMVMPDEYQTPSILYIIKNNATLETIMEPLVEWRTEKGFEVHLVTTSETGTSNTSIQAYIQNAYDTWTNPPEFVCLVGDATGTYSIPTFIENWTWYNGEGDHPYVWLDGGDYISDAFVGRISFSTTSNLSSIVSKLVNYEKNPYMADTDWYTRALLVGDPSSSGLSTIMTNRFIDELSEYHGYSGNYTVFSGSWVTQIASGLNNGVSFFNYRGYLGMSGWGNSNTNSLSNGPRLPFATILTCGTGSFTGDSRSEAFLRAGTVSVPKGAIAAIGTATSGTHTLYNNCVAGGMYQGIFNEKLYYAGAAVERGRINLNMSYPSNNSNFVQVFSHWNNLMGDPATEFWTGVPGNLTVEVADNIPGESRWLGVNVSNDLGLGVGNAWVTAYQANGSLFASAHTNGDGYAQIDLSGVAPGSLVLTTSKHNFKPDQTTVSVSSDDFAVRLDTVTFAETSGNGDNIVNSGETAALVYTVSNHSDATVSGIDITVTHEDGSIIQDYYISSLDAGEAYTSSPLSVILPSDYPGVADLDIMIELIQNETGWTDHRRFPISAPFFEVANLSEGGGIPSFDPGEITDLVVTLKNEGRNLSSGLTATLVSEHSEVIVESGTATFGDVGANGIISNLGEPFSVELSSQLTVGIQAPMHLELTDASGYNQIVPLRLPIGTPSVGDPLGPDQYGYLAYDSGDLAYAMAPTYNWIEIKPGLGGWNGDLVPLNDFGENQEDIVNVDLPFNFGFYGIDYYEIGVGSNGYISLGPSDQAIFRNWRLPGALGPSPMVAAFWDDLKLGGSAGVYTYFNQSAHYFVIEWYNMINRYNNNAYETFQIILYDPDYYGSEDGNGDILIQYKDFNNVDANDGYSSHHGNYATVGLENHDASDGLEYTYNNTYPVQAAPLADDMAIFFTTRTDAILPCPGWARADINNDGGQNVQDLVILVNILLGNTNPGECEFWAADMTYDSTLTVGDLVLMVDEVMGFNLGRPTGVDPAMTVMLDAKGISMDASGDTRAFMLDIHTDEQPRLNQVDGVELNMDSPEDGVWRVLGYTTNATMGEFQLAWLNDENASIQNVQAAGADGSPFEVETVLVPRDFAVTAVYPNPFNPRVSIDYSLPVAGDADMKVYNALGQLIYQQSQSQAMPGEYSFTWNGVTASGQTVASGVYFARISSAAGSELVKLTMLK